MQELLHQTLKEYFGFGTFRPLQLEISIAAMEGNDVLALMPTGGGKSLCYQVPGLAKDGLCLVISPLIALMNDQVQNLRKKNITAFSIHTGMARKEVINVLETASHSNCKFLYVSPERLETSLFKEYLPGLGVNFIAVDEAHCISQWGYDFRPPYLRISQLREELPGVPVIALTASATELVQKDICKKLSVDEADHFKIFRQSFERRNLSYSVFHVDSRINKIADILNNVQGTAIVYCKTRKRTKEIAELLRMQGISADHYNAGLTTEERSKKQNEWIQNKVRVIVCTNAFGMGIDKPDVRVVIHADVPDCLENYYQEAGRAGRDGKRSFAVLLFDEPEIEGLKQMPGIRYPDVETIRKVYRSVVHYLQLPEGEVPGDYYDFDLKDFIKKFDLDLNATIYGLKALEQDGWLSFNEQVFIPSTVRFTIFKNALYDYEGGHGDTRAGCPVETGVLEQIQGVRHLGHRVTLCQIVHQRRQVLLVGDVLVPRVVLGQRLVEEHATQGGLDDGGLAGFPTFGGLPAGVRHEVLQLDLALGVQVQITGVVGHDGFGDGRVAVALTGPAVTNGGQVVQTDDHVLRRQGDRLTVRGLEDVVRGQHQHASLGLCLRGQRQVHRHLVTVEVGVERTTHERVQLNGLTFDQLRLERLNTQTVQGGSTVQQNRVLGDDLFEDIPHLRASTLDHALGRLDVLRVAEIDQTLHHERLEQLERHQLRQAALVQLQLRADDDDRTA